MVGYHVITRQQVLRKTLLERTRLVLFSSYSAGHLPSFASSNSLATPPLPLHAFLLSRPLCNKHLDINIIMIDT